MPYINAEGIDFYYEEIGAGEPILFIHEMAGNYRSWEPQLRYFSKRNRCIVYSARGYPPSSIPDDPAVYSQEQAATDAIAILDNLGIDKAHIVGLSMGSFATVQLGLDYADRALSLTIVGCGSGSELHIYEERQAAYRTMAKELFDGKFDDFVTQYGSGPYRQPFMRKDPRAWQAFVDRFRENSPLGTALTLQNIQARRPSLWDLETRLQNVDIPSLVICGDRDHPCVQPSIFLSRALRKGRLSVFADTGHTVNLEEPDLFNQILQNFITNHG
ncbi:MAG TPA: alpha/beta hydrolase [Eoetvoesiella sp.]